MENQKYCKHCGQLIDKECVVCPKCGKQVEKLDGDTPIIINNSASSSASSTATAQIVKPRKKYNLLFDIFMIMITGGLWIFWMIFRPKE